MSQKPLAVTTTEHPYCVDYFLWMDKFEAERLKRYEVDDIDVDSAEDFFARTVDGPFPSEDKTPEITLDEFEDLFSNSPFVY